jgi:hypothetical protein
VEGTPTDQDRCGTRTGEDRKLFSVEPLEKSPDEKTLPTAGTPGQEDIVGTLLKDLQGILLARGQRGHLAILGKIRRLSGFGVTSIVLVSA